MRLRPLCMLLAALAMGSCTRNAALEVRMQLSQEGSDPRAYVRVIARPATSAWPFTEDWDFDGEIFPLSENLCEDEGGACNVRFGVLSEEPSTTDVRLRVIYCRAPDCSDFDDGAAPPELWFELRRPFYRGRTTRWDPGAAPPFDFYPADAPQPDAAPEAPIVVGACAIEGCVNDFMAADRGWCDEAGVHFCESI